MVRLHMSQQGSTLLICSVESSVRDLDTTSQNHHRFQTKAGLDVSARRGTLKCTTRMLMLMHLQHGRFSKQETSGTYMWMYLRFV